MFEEARPNNQNQHVFTVTRKGTDYFLKKSKDVKPDEEGPIFAGSYKEARKLWHRLMKDKNVS